MIVTTYANAELKQIHDRMPLLNPRDAHALWLDRETSLADVLKLAERSPALEIHPVGFGVNDPRKDDETLIAPVVQGLGGAHS